MSTNSPTNSPTSSYDLIVIGDDISGLIAATLCAKRGMRVLVLRHGGRPASYQLGPHRLPVEPLPFCGLSSPAIKRVLAELHLAHSLKRKLDERPVSFQFVAPDVRIDVGMDDEQLAGELERELGDAELALEVSRGAADISEHFDAVLGGDSEFPPIGFWKRREVGRSASKVSEDALAWFAQLESHDLAAAFIGLPAILGTRTGPATLSAAACARSFQLWRQGAPRLHGDWETLRELLQEKLTQGNGEIKSARVTELTFSWGKVNGVRLDSGEELGAAHVIAALPIDQLVPLVEQKQPKRLAQLVESMSIAGYRYTLNLVVDEAGIPEGMSSPVLVLGNPDEPPIGHNAVAIYLDTPDAEARVVVTVSAVCPAPAAGESLDTAFADLRVRLRERLEMVMPFFSEHVVLAHAPYEATPPEGIDASVDPSAGHGPGHGAEVGRSIPVAPAPVWESSLESALGVSAMPYSVGIKNLTVASSQVLPQLGLEGAFTTGWCAAKIACDATGKKRDYLKDEVIVGG